jgi:hypothetical protein
MCVILQLQDSKVKKKLRYFVENQGILYYAGELGCYLQECPKKSILMRFYGKLKRPGKRDTKIVEY